MAFQNYPNYSPYFQQQTYTPQASYHQNTGLLWVQGEAGAKAYMVAPGNTVILMDTEKSRFYIKGADGSGMPTLRTFEYTEVTGQQTPQGGSEAVTDLEKRFVTREEFREIMDKNNMLIEAVQKATAALKGKAGEE